jgi:hypothetical protein
VAIAWAPGAGPTRQHAKTVVRAGFGIFGSAQESDATR